MSLHTVILSSPPSPPSRALCLKRALVGVVSVAAIFAFVAAPLQAGTPAYGGVGARLASFDAANAHGVGTPPAGQTYYQVDNTRQGRVTDYHVVVGSPSKRSTSAILARLTGQELPNDAQVVKPYNGYCAVYRSRWLGKVLWGLPRHYFGKLERFGYAIVIVNRKGGWWNEVNSSIVPACRG
jgi:hypothetical protein